MTGYILAKNIDECSLWSEVLKCFTKTPKESEETINFWKYRSGNVHLLILLALNVLSCQSSVAVIQPGS